MPRGRMLDKEAISQIERHSLSHKIRLYIYKRDDLTCQYCGKKGTFIYRFGKPCVVENPLNIPLFKYDHYNGHDVTPFEIDHIIEVYDGGDNSIDNLILSCRKCNRAKGNKSRKIRRLNGKI